MLLSNTCDCSQILSASVHARLCLNQIIYICVRSSASFHLLTQPNFWLSVQRSPEFCLAQCPFCLFSLLCPWLSIGFFLLLLLFLLLFFKCVCVCDWGRGEGSKPIPSTAKTVYILEGPSRLLNTHNTCHVIQPRNTQQLYIIQSPYAHTNSHVIQPSVTLNNCHRIQSPHTHTNCRII